MKSAAVAMVVAAAVVSADSPANYSDYSAYTSGVYTGDNVSLSAATYIPP